MSKSPLFLDTKPVSYIIGNGALAFSEKSLKKYQRIIMLVDENVKKHCLPVFREHLPKVDIDHLIIIKSGEKQKNLDQAVFIWNELTRLKVARDTLFINMGGGVVTDIGGFVASTYKRGISFINGIRSPKRRKNDVKKAGRKARDAKMDPEPRLYRRLAISMM